MKTEKIKVPVAMGLAENPWDRVEHFLSRNPTATVLKAMDVIERLTMKSVSSYKHNLDEALKMAESARKRYVSATSERKENRARKDWIAAMERAQEAADKINGVVRTGTAAATGLAIATVSLIIYAGWRAHNQRQQVQHG